MPDNQGAGMLETLCLKTLENQEIEKCIKQYIDCFEPYLAISERDKFNRSKSSVLAYLASRAPITNALGTGAEKGYWNFSHTCFDELRQFLHTLFDE